jgi:hypothetical protein
MYLEVYLSSLNNDTIRFQSISSLFYNFLKKNRAIRISNKLINKPRQKQGSIGIYNKRMSHRE